MKTLNLNWPTKLLLPLALLGLAATGLRATDFPQWRGPLRDGHSPETGLLQEWPKAGPKLLWQVQTVGAGYSTPSVVGKRIYLLANEGSEESVLALDVKDGGRVWATKLGKVGHPEQNPNYPGARSTPSVDGKFLFALGSDGDLVCLKTANGEEVWRKHLRNEYGGKYGEWAYSESPLVDGNKLIVTPGGTNATLLALNKKTGEVIWTCATPEGDEASYSSVVSATFSGVKQYIQFLSKGLVGVDAKTGKLLWRFEKTAKGSPAVIMTVLVDDGMVYSGAFRANTALIKPVLKDGVFTVEEIYSNNKLPIGLGGVVKVGDYFYGSSSQSAMCVDFKTGTVKWEERAIGPCSWLVADKRIYLHAESGEVALIEPSGEAYREKGRFSPPNPPTRGQAKAWAYPVMANGRLYIREQNLLWCYDVKAGK
ncbi:MAG: PQQ-like beta-propeller repeat protein [Verrucomicrobia bacterium]|nr:PQQ-like beta-propeller repeat protein [Verrucomicrobiota bacterium]